MLKETAVTTWLDGFSYAGREKGRKGGREQRLAQAGSALWGDNCIELSGGAVGVHVLDQKQINQKSVLRLLNLSATYSVIQVWTTFGLTFNIF